MLIISLSLLYVDLFFRLKENSKKAFTAKTGWSPQNIRFLSRADCMFAP